MFRRIKINVFLLAIVALVSSVNSVCQVQSGFATPMFTLTAPSVVLAAQGAVVQDANLYNIATIPITVTSVNGFNSPVTLSVSGAPNSFYPTFTTGQVTPTANGTASTDLLLQAGPWAPITIYNLTITGSSGSITQQISISVTVNPAPFTMPFAHAAFITPGTTVGNSGLAAYPILYSLQSVNGWGGFVNLSTSGFPAGVTVGFFDQNHNPVNEVMLPPGGVVSFYVVLSASSNAPNADFTEASIIGTTNSGITETSPFWIGVD
jgi:hypothetical protein